MDIWIQKKRSIAQKLQHHKSGAERTAIIDFSPSQHASYRM